MKKVKYLPLKNFISYISRGITPKYTESDGICVLNQKCIRNNRISIVQARKHNIKAKNISNDKLLRKWDILVNSTGTGTLGRVAQIKQDVIATADSHITIVRPNQDVNAAFLGYALKYNQQSIEALAEGSTGQTELSKEKLKERILIPCFEYKEQAKISEILLYLDERLELNEKINQNLETQAQAIFKSWFVDFEPFGGKMPADWKAYKLGEFLPVITGKKNANVSSSKGKYPFFSCAQDTAWTDEFSFDANAILVAGNGDFNVKFYSGKFEAYQRTYVLIPHNPTFTNWLYYVVKYNLERITSGARGSVIKFITKGNLEDFSFFAPRNLDKLTPIDFFNSTNNKIAENKLEILKLAQLRDTLLPKLMSGEIDVSDVAV